MKIGILGSGIVGQVLGKAFLAEGNEVMLGTRDTSKPEVQKWAAENKAGRVGDFKEVAKFGEIIVLATGGSVAENAIKLAGKEYFSNKVIIDATNPIAAAPPVNGVMQFFTDFNESLMEKLQKLVPEANFVKAFSSVGSAYMHKPKFPGGTPTMFICGNNESAKKKVTDILTQFGWETEDMGMVEAARAIEPLSMLWCIPGFTKNRWNHAFKLLKQ